ncbi:MAG: hypothetical protein JKY33_04065 [Bacteroidia bacterium]|nr:hypothetical protein [Bacteroidia bacterium]
MKQHSINLSALLQCILVAIIPIMLSSCGSTLSSFQTAKTVEKNKLAAGFGVSISQRNDYAFVTEKDNDTLLAGSVPIFDFYGRFGISDEADAGVKISPLSGEIILEGKYRFYENEKYYLNAAGGFGAGITRLKGDSKVGDVVVNSWKLGVTNFYFPTYFSFNPSEYFSLYINPKYIFRIVNYKNFIEPSQLRYTSHAYGCTYGVLWGHKSLNRSWIFKTTPSIAFEVTFVHDTELKKRIWQAGFGIGWNIR